MASDWFDWMEESLTQIDTIFPLSSREVQKELVNRFRHLQHVNDEWLDEWLLLQDRFRDMVAKYPELGNNGGSFAQSSINNLSEHKDQTDGSEQESEGFLEFWIDEQVLKQFRIGQGYYELSMLPQALTQFLKVTETEPDFLLGRLYLALTYFQSEDWEQAEKQFRFVLETAPHDEFRRFAHHMLGCLLVKQETDVKAIRHFSCALEIDGDDTDTLFNLGACYYRLRSIRMAVPCFEQAVTLDGDDWESMLYLANCYTALMDHEQATYWREQAYHTSQKPRIITEIADHYEQQDRLEEALAWNMFSVTKHPEWAEGYHGVAWNLWKKGHDSEAVVWLKKALTLKRDDPNMLFSYWWIAHRHGTDREKERFDQRLPDMIQSPLWQLAFGNHYRVKGDYPLAIKMLRPLLHAEERRIQGAAHYQLAHLFMAEQRWKEAVKHFHKARERDEHLRETWLFEGICHYLNGDEKASRDCLQWYQADNL